MTFQIRFFHAGDGDCVLLSAGDSQESLTHMLVDGGRSTSFKSQAAEYLYDNDDLQTLDLVVVSHIDNDHISGILQLLKDKVKHTVWQVKQESRQRSGQPRREPKRPPDISKLWHNSVTQALGDRVDPVEAQQSLATSAALLGGRFLGMTGSEGAEDAAKLDDIATGHRSALELEGRIKGKLGIETEDELIVVPEGTKARRSRRRVGAFSITVIGPTNDRIKALRKDWEKWIADNEHARVKLMQRLRSDEQEMGVISPDSVSPESIAQGSSGGSITVPNLASLMLLVRSEDKSILLTGDGSSEDILDGLERSGIDDPHVDVLKVQHHGATANVTAEFCEQVTADHYVFCGNGAHSNPELEVLETIATARLASGAGPDQPFTFWFTSRTDSPGLSDRRVAHMRQVEAEMAVMERWIMAKAADPDLEREDFDADPDLYPVIDEPRLRSEFLTEGYILLDL